MVLSDTLMPLSGKTLSRRTSLRAFASGVDWQSFRSAVSLHAHTSHSRETLSDLPPYIHSIPIIGDRFRRELDERRAQQMSIDFSKGWWHPPATPREVFDSETGQIDRRFGLDSIVSVTDHDDINAGIELRRLFAAGRSPVSFEWTVPFGTGFFHLGIHDLPAGDESRWFARLEAFTADRRTEPLGLILRDLHAAGVLVVFNHPLWDLAGVGPSLHTAHLREFLDEHQAYVHALEINGYRSWRENGGARALSAERGLPLISGGDRHALEPNAVLNLTQASTFAEFAAEVRDGVSHVVVMPEYRRHIAVRILGSAADVMAKHSAFPPSRRRWHDRVTLDWEGRVAPLTHHWPDGGPLWVRSSIAVFRVVTSPAVMSVWGAALGRLDGRLSVSAIPAIN
jgi:hypothetical protein